MVDDIKKLLEDVEALLKAIANMEVKSLKKYTFGIKSSSSDRHDTNIRSAPDTYVIEWPQYAESLQLPYNNDNDVKNIQDVFDISIYRYFLINEPEQHANHDKGED